MGFARASGLITSVRQFEQRPWNSTISENWFTEGLVQGSLLLCDLIRIGEEVWSTIDRYFDRYNVTLHKVSCKLVYLRYYIKIYVVIDLYFEIKYLALFSILYIYREKKNI